MDYLGVLSKAFRLAWKNKFLWFFGFFVGGISLNFSSGINFNTGGMNDAGNWLGDLNNNQNEIIAFVLLMLIILCIVFIIWLILRLVSEGALIYSMDTLDKNKKTRFRQCMAVGVNYFWRMLGLSIVIGFMSMCVVILFVLPAAVSFYYSAWITGVIWTFIAIVCLIIWGVFIGLLYRFSVRYMILKDHKVFASINHAMHLIRNRIGKSIVMLVLIFIVNALLALVTLVALLIIAFPVIFSYLLSYVAFRTAGLVFIAIVTGSVFLFFLIVYKSLYGSFISAVWTLFFNELQLLEDQEKLRQKAIKASGPKEKKAKIVTQAVVKPRKRKPTKKATSTKKVTTKNRTAAKPKKTNSKRKTTKRSAPKRTLTRKTTSKNKSIAKKKKVTTSKTPKKTTRKTKNKTTTRKTKAKPRTTRKTKKKK